MLFAQWWRASSDTCRRVLGHDFTFHTQTPRGYHTPVLIGDNKSTFVTHDTTSTEPLVGPLSKAQ